MSWFKRIKRGINTKTVEKKEAPDGLWQKCKKCSYTGTKKEFSDTNEVCPSCGFHRRVGSKVYFDMLFDEKNYTLHFDNLQPKDFLQFSDLKSYKTRIGEANKKTGLNDAIRVAEGQVNGLDLIVAAMDFSYIGGSMGSVVGEKIARGINLAIEKKTPFLVISKSGGARMMESSFSLMQMAKTSAKLTQLADAQIPYLVLLTDPTTGGVSASFAMLGDVILAEPEALIAFAGPRVIKETIKKDLPPGFQRSEFLLEKGFVDKIVPRPELKKEIGQFLQYFSN